MKKLFILALAVLLVIGLFSGCQMETPGSSTESATQPAETESTAATDQAPEGDEEIIIGYTPLSMEMEYFQNVVKAMEDTAAKYGNVTIMVKDPQMDAATQMTGIEDMIAAGADYICICSIDVATAENSTAYVHEKGKKVISHVSAFEGADVYVGLDEYTFGFMEGEAAGKYIKENLDGKGVVAILDADSLGGDLLLRSKGIEEGILSQAPDSVIIKSTAFEEEVAMTTTETLLLENPDINFICTTNDPGALGALAAVESKGVGDKVTISAIGSEERLIKAVAEGKILFTVDSGASTAGVAMVEVAVKLSKGEEVDKNITVDTPFVDQAEAKIRIGQ